MMDGTRFSLALALAAGALATLAQGVGAQTPGANDPMTGPAGTGPYPAIYEELSTLPTHVVYRPAVLANLGERRLGIYVFGNGACSADGTSARNHLLEIASHGYLAIAPGVIPRPDRPVPTPERRESGRLSAATPVEALREAIDWAIREDGRRESPFYGRIATDRIAVSGWSCGGLQALVTATDPRVKTSVIMYSGIFNDGGNPIEGIEIYKSLLGRIHGSVLYVLGSPTDMAYPNGMDDFRRITGRPAAVVNIPVGHGGTFAEPNGGLGAQVVTAWLAWQLEGEDEAARRFRGSDCGFCSDPRLTMERKNID
jgi:dienelactone hydrolase